MKLEAGKKYVTRKGNKIYGPLVDRREFSGYTGDYPFECPTHFEAWTEDGDYFFDDGVPFELDLVAEYREASPVRHPVLDPDGLEVGPVLQAEGPIAKLHRELGTFELSGLAVQDGLLVIIKDLLDHAKVRGYDLDETLKQGQV
jgi:hypothetical protein